MTNQSGLVTLSSSFCGSRSDETSTLFASSISDSVRCLMKTGFPRHLMMTFLPSGIALISTSTLAIARTSADADMLTSQSVTVACAATAKRTPYVPVMK